MSFQDDVIEPQTVESAEHLAELLRNAWPAEAGRANSKPPKRAAPGGVLPRALGN